MPRAGARGASLIRDVRVFGGTVCLIDEGDSAGAILVTGNTRHYPKRSRVGVTVLSPGEFIELLRRSP